MLKVTSLLSTIIFSATSLCHAQRMTAVCSEPTGYTVVFRDKKFNSSRDGIDGATLSYSWDKVTKKATIITQHSNRIGGAPLSYAAQVIPVSNRQVTFLVLFEKGVETHSLFLDDGIVYFSAQKDTSDFYPGSSSGKIFTAKCKLGNNDGARE